MSMKKTVLTFGLISGAFSAVMMLLTVPFLDRIGFDHGEVLGYTLILLSFLLVFFGVRSYRENVGDGTVSFGRAFAVGLLITLISSACYVITWEFIYFKLAPGFADKYAAHAMAQVKASGADQQKIDETARQMAELKVMLDKPLLNAAMTFMEPLPVGLIVTLVSAGVLKKKKAAGIPRSAV
jgi:hypothetical protein